MRSFLKSVKQAMKGILMFFRHERNAKIQGCIAIITIALSVWLHISGIEWVLVLLCIALVIGLEMLNTAIEKIGNQLTTDLHPDIKIIKDVSAGAVLWSSICSAIIGGIIFIPKIIHHIFNT
ncbi:diacylglycerol kinase family protein [Hydrotalea sp.]|uniref:diacylglycerol kinase family protein n=1 Tax=Hydrotalea sp. TaxID=2881279 RepID=UPI00261A06B7|nr:diacylglycerol kinase family protein [Hydrotalea sp.]